MVIYFVRNVGKLVAMPDAFASNVLKQIVSKIVRFHVQSAIKKNATLYMNVSNTRRKIA